MIRTIQIYIQAYLKYRRAKKELYSLTDKDLLDIGVYRWDIENIAQETFKKELSKGKTSPSQLAWSRQ